MPSIKTSIKIKKDNIPNDWKVRREKEWVEKVGAKEFEMKPVRRIDDLRNRRRRFEVRIKDQGIASNKQLVERLLRDEYSIDAFGQVKDPAGIAVLARADNILKGSEWPDNKPTTLVKDLFKVAIEMQKSGASGDDVVFRTGLLFAVKYNLLGYTNMAGMLRGAALRYLGSEDALDILTKKARKALNE